MSPARRPAAAVTALSDPAAALRVDAACRTLALPTVRAEAWPDRRGRRPGTVVPRRFPGRGTDSGV
jgi:hypothetical protein